jgi:hypothetical protein
LTKQDLLNQSFALDNSNLEKLKKIQNQMVLYMADNELDCQLSDALKIIEIKIVENISNDYKKTRQMAQSIFDRIIKKNDWGLNDLRILSNIIDYSETYIQAHNLILKATETLKNIPDQGKHEAITLGFHMDMILRLIRERFYDLEKSKNHFELGDIVDIFGFHYQAAKVLCERNGYLVYNAIANIRKGIFANNSLLLDEGFDVLKKANKENIHRMLKAEVDEYTNFSKYSKNTQ